ncbi:hypothetical protein VKT23_020200 [Stygiomarasmius scandens]|uniref:Uncharacterized protein n=1 Tax=Marasmiellus scandens TaxID=2682957 RepID=A0ABR1IJM2_9AGAR
MPDEDETLFEKSDQNDDQEDADMYSFTPKSSQPNRPTDSPAAAVTTSGERPRSSDQLPTQKPLSPSNLSNLRSSIFILISILLSTILEASATASLLPPINRTGTGMGINGHIFQSLGILAYPTTLGPKQWWKRFSYS